MARDMLSLLERDHREVETLMKDIISAGENDKVDTRKVNKLNQSLLVHTKIEEKLLYPKAQKEREVSNLIKDGFQEHQEIRDLLERFVDADSPREVVRFCQEIQKKIQHHVHEEEGQVFPTLRDLWENDVLEDLGEQMMEMKDRELAGH